ncbi:MAG: ROK family protein [Ktedonobacteraceae bacterium]
MRIDRSVAVGVEIASGRATVALIDRHGRILQRCPVKTLRGRPAYATLEPYLNAIDTMLQYAHVERLRVRGIGVSIPGSLDSTAQTPLSIPTLPALNDVPLRNFLEVRYGLPTRLSVDVDAATIGEYHFGAGQGVRRLLFLTINAVVGAALVTNGHVEQTELQQYTGHVCHLLISTNGPRCSCGKHGCINTLISIDAMQKMVRRALRRGEESNLTRRILNREYFSLQLLAEEASRGDSVALKVYGELGRWLSSAITKYVTLFEPDALILSGSVIHGNELLFTQVHNTLVTSPSSSSNVSTVIKVLSASLGNDATLMGVTVSLF